jgi:hypothetical protein
MGNRTICSSSTLGSDRLYFTNCGKELTINKQGSFIDFAFRVPCIDCAPPPFPLMFALFV